MSADQLIQRQKKFYSSGITRDYHYRIDNLKKLKKAIQQNEKAITSALYKDLNKSEFESYMSEIGLVYEELNHAIKNLRKWMKPEQVRTPITLFPAKSVIQKEPYGCVLIISAWNYPFQLAFAPLVAAIAAGNCAIVKMSELAPAASVINTQIISDTFSTEYVAAVEGGVDMTTELLARPFNYIFFTGSPAVGKIVMKAAAENLVPVTLELGGKSPCIVDESAALNPAAKKIVFGKYLNAGQTCIAPDYLLVQRDVKQRLVIELEKAIKKMIPDALNNLQYPKIITARHFDRLIRLMSGANIISGGGYDCDKCKIEPTLVDGVTFDHPVMLEEIFGPILPVLTFSDLNEASELISRNSHPLALYVFSENQRNINSILDQVPFGGGCVNDILLHISSTYLPFGGVGNSGMGSYHGEYGFDAFTHQKGIVRKSKWLDMPMRYQPFPSDSKMLKRFIH
jgi:aldehyde dehydrogenase (NAD+)